MCPDECIRILEGGDSIRISASMHCCMLQCGVSVHHCLSVSQVNYPVDQMEKIELLASNTDEEDMERVVKKNGRNLSSRSSQRSVYLKERLKDPVSSLIVAILAITST